MSRMDATSFNDKDMPWLVYLVFNFVCLMFVGFEVSPTLLRSYGGVPAFTVGGRP